MAEEITVSSAEFQEFVEIQNSGKYNMLDPMVRTIMGISKDKHLYIISHYNDLEKEFGGNE